MMPATAKALQTSLPFKRPARVVVIILAALASGLMLDWFRPAQRLVFPRPLPVFKITPSVS